MSISICKGSASMAPQRRKAPESLPESPTKKARGRPKKVTTVPQKVELKLSQEEFDSTLDLLTARLSGKADSLVLSGVDKTKSDLKAIVNCAVNDYLGNSSILIGPRASGKSTLVKRVLKDVASAHEAVRMESIFLHGSILSECQSALKFLLSKVKELVSGQKSTASATVDYSASPEEEFSEFVAFDQLTAMIRQFLSEKKEKRFLVFVLEDLEKFAAHPQQNLLYSLFEMTLALPVYVLGVSCRLDVLELLEKRVKSRCSQNVIYLPLPEDEEAFTARILDNLRTENTQINQVFEKFVSENEAFKAFVAHQFALSKEVRPVFNVLLLTCAEIASQGCSFDWFTFPQVFESALLSQKPYSSTIAAVAETTLIELMVLTALCRLNGKFPGSAVTFDAMYEEMCACKLRAQKLDNFQWTKSMIQIAFDRLIACRLILPATSANVAASMNRAYLTVRLGLPNFLLTEAIAKHPYDSKEISALACERIKSNNYVISENEKENQGAEDVQRGHQSGVRDVDEFVKHCVVD